MGGIAGSRVLRFQVKGGTFLGQNAAFYVQIVPERLMDKIGRVEVPRLKIDRVDIVSSRSVHDSAHSRPKARHRAHAAGLQRAVDGDSS